MSNGRKQHFLEVYLPNLSSQRLKIPSNFIKHLTGRISGLVSLMGPSGNSWQVHLVEVTSNLYLDDGWNVFVRDHSIEYGDSLVFGYDGNWSFTVQIFDQTQCEKEEAFFANCSQELSDISGNLANKRNDGESAFSDTVGEKRMMVNWIPTDLDLEFGINIKQETSVDEGQEHEESLRNSCHNSHDPSETSENPFLLALPAEESPTFLPSTNEQEKRNDVSSETSYKTRKMPRRKKHEVSSETSYKFRTPRGNKNDVSSETSYKLRKTPGRKINDVPSKTSYKTIMMPIRKKNALVPKTTHAKNEVRTRIKRRINKTIEENAAQRFTSNFPYFVKYINSCQAKGGVTTVPAWFSEHLPPGRTMVTLRNLDGGSWLVNCVSSRRKYSTVHAFSGGWLNFVRDNGIKEKDICIFELVAKDEMLVHISRLGKKGMGRGMPLKGNKAVLKDNDVHPLKKLVDINELSMDNTEDHTKVASSSDNVSTLQNPVTRGKRKDKLPRCNTEDARSDQTRRTMKDPHSLTSPFPHFKKVMLSSNISGNSTLEIPMEFSSKHLPPSKKKIILRNMNGDRWHVYSCPHKRRTNFIGGWSSFVKQNDLKVGDTCFFELVKKWVLQVQVFKSHQRLEDCPNSSDTDDASEYDPDYDLEDDYD